MIAAEEFTLGDFPVDWTSGWPEPLLPDELEFDNGSCSTPGCGQTIGGYLDEDPDTGYPRSSWNSPWLLRSACAAPRWVCEDCVCAEDTEDES